MALVASTAKTSWSRHGPTLPSHIGAHFSLSPAEALGHYSQTDRMHTFCSNASHHRRFLNQPESLAFASNRFPWRICRNSVGLAPGLTNLLAAAVHAAAPGPVDLAVFLGAGERHGAAAVAWSYGLLGRRFRDPGTGGQVRNYTQPQRFDLPGQGRRRLYRADFCDQHVLTRDLQVPVRTYFGLDSRLATVALAALTWIPGASGAPRGLHLPGSDRWLVLARGQDGTSRWASGRVESHATAVLAATAARAVGGLTAGVHHLHQVLTLADVPAGRGIHLQHGALR